MEVYDCRLSNDINEAKNQKYLGRYLSTYIWGFKSERRSPNYLQYQITVMKKPSRQGYNFTYNRVQNRRIRWGKARSLNSGKSIKITRKHKHKERGSKCRVQCEHFDNVISDRWFNGRLIFWVAMFKLNICTNIK